MGFEITNRPPSYTVILHLLLLLFPQLLPMATAFASFTSIASHSSSCLITRRRRVPVRVWDPQDFSRRDEAGSSNVRNSLLQIHSAHTHIFHIHTDHLGWWEEEEEMGC
jgi:hypothetical protein